VKPRIRSVFVLAVVIGASAYAVPTNATNTTCAYISADHEIVMTVSLIEDVRLFVNGAGEFKWEDTQAGIVEDCQKATVENTDLVEVNDFTNSSDLPEIILDFRRKWGPGFTPEGTPRRSEIEVEVNDNSGGEDELFVLGTHRRDTMVFGGSGFNLNDDNDGDDVTLLTGVIEVLYVKGGARADLLSVRGGSDTGSEFVTNAITLQGDAGADSLFGGSGDEDLRGIDGDDRMFGATGIDQIFADEGDDLLRGGGGADELDGMRGRDRLRGQEGPDDLEGGPGEDDLDGGPGSDMCSGGAGPDSLARCEN
jgi:Ca2+-binding RTX toxin-like protein